MHPITKEQSDVWKLWQNYIQHLCIRFSFYDFSMIQSFKSSSNIKPNSQYIKSNEFKTISF